MPHQCAQWSDDQHLSVVMEQAWSLMLASAEGDDASEAAILAQIDDCPKCLRTIVRHLVGAFVGLAVNQFGHDEVITETKATIARLHNARDT